MLKETCIRLLHELEEYKNKDKEDLLLTYINDRLNKSFDSYQADIEQSIEYLNYKNELRVMKKLNRMNK